MARTLPPGVAGSGAWSRFENGIRYKADIAEGARPQHRGNHHGVAVGDREKGGSTSQTCSTWQQAVSVCVAGVFLCSSLAVPRSQLTHVSCLQSAPKWAESARRIAVTVAILDTFQSCRFQAAYGAKKNTIMLDSIYGHKTCVHVHACLCVT